MRKTISTMLLTFVSSSAAAGWVVVGGGEKFTAYADPGTIHRAGDMVRMWNLFDYKTARSFEGKRFLSSTMQYEYDCKRARERLLYTSARSRNMGKGDALVTDPFPHDWRPLPHGSIIEELRSYACRTP